ncbi:MAG: formate/nitrite transporter family protein [Firmicutes bacterium]|nr:formate/nitrite transporter family protein [Bacillota bacterium]
MENSCLSPGKICEAWIETGFKKGTSPAVKLLLLGILGGLFIGLGGHGNIVANSFISSLDPGLARLAGAAVFPVGLMLVILAGAELFTGNNLMTLAVANRRISPAQLLKNWVIVYIGNFIGAVLLALLLSKTSIYGSEAIIDKAVAIASGKLGQTFLQALISGIFCNILVVLACWMQAGAKEMAGKIFAIWFPIMLFVFSGFEHSIANMFFLPLARFLGADIGWGQVWSANLIPVTIGNILGGAVFIPFIYHYVYALKDADTPTAILRIKKSITFRDTR